MYRAGEVSVTEHAARGLPNPTPGGGGGTIYPGSRPADVTIVVFV